jgi:ribonuclease E
MSEGSTSVATTDGAVRDRTTTEPTRDPSTAAEPTIELQPSEGSPGTAADDGSATTTRRRRRGRRGGRGRRRPSGATSAASAESATAVEDAQDEGVAGEPVGDEPASPTETAATKRRRRRRGGRGRARAKTTAGAETDAPAESGEASAETGEEAEASAGGPTSTRSRRRRTRSRAKPATEEPDETSEESKAAPVSTRLSRPRSRVRTIRGSRRRREPIALTPRVTDKLMVITEHGERDQIAVLEGRDLVQHYVTRAKARSMVGNVYLGRVQNVLPGMEAAFVDVGRGRNAVLYAGEVNWSVEDLDGAPARIERVLKPGQPVLVQVTKDPIGGKGARLTAQISVPGRYLVLAPGSNVTGISRRLPDAERRRLKAIQKKIRPDGHGLIVRTAAEGASEEDLTADVERLLATWKDIEKRSKRAKAPSILYEEPELTVRVVRDLFTDEEYRELVTDSPRVYELVTDYLREIAPDLLAKVRLHQGKLPAFEEFHIVEQIHKGLDRKVWLPSGGYVVIDRTEALTVIDVNTGRSVGKTNLEETVVNTNLEAAREIARQLRLRDIGGMIVIDFIDMLLEQNKKKVIATLEEALAQDKSRAQVFDISPLGLLEVTRKRVSGGLLEAFSETCPTCEGRGVILTYDVS